MANLQRFFVEYDNFEDSMLYITGSEERKARLDFKRKIDELIQEYPENSQLYHKVGLCLYNMSEWEEDDKKFIELAFHRALILDEKSIFSVVFLVHFYFDIGEFALSLKCHEAIEKEILDDVPKWRVVKLLGLKLCCQVEMEIIDNRELLKELSILFNKYTQLDDDDLEVAEPIELLKALRGKREKYCSDERISDIVKKLNAIVEQKSKEGAK